MPKARIASADEQLLTLCYLEDTVMSDVSQSLVHLHESRFPLRRIKHDDYVCI